MANDTELDEGRSPGNDDAHRFMLKDKIASLEKEGKPATAQKNRLQTLLAKRKAEKRGIVTEEGGRWVYDNNGKAREISAAEAAATRKATVTARESERAEQDKADERAADRRGGYGKGLEEDVLLEVKPNKVTKPVHTHSIAGNMSHEDKKQEVSLGMSQSGRPGWFTNNMMAISLTPEEHAKFSKDPVAAKAHASKFGFKLKEEVMTKITESTTTIGSLRTGITADLLDQVGQYEVPADPTDTVTEVNTYTAASMTKLAGWQDQLDEGTKPKVIPLGSDRHPAADPSHPNHAAWKAAKPKSVRKPTAADMFKTPRVSTHEKPISAEDAFNAVKKEGIGEADHTVYAHNVVHMHNGKKVAAKHIGTYHSINGERDMGFTHDDPGAGDTEEIFHHIVHRDSKNPKKLHVYQTGHAKNWHGIDESVELDDTYFEMLDEAKLPAKSGETSEEMEARWAKEKAERPGIMKRNKETLKAAHKKLTDKGYQYLGTRGMSGNFDDNITRHTYLSPDKKHLHHMEHSAYSLGWKEGPNISHVTEKFKKDKMLGESVELDEASSYSRENQYGLRHREWKGKQGGGTLTTVESWHKSPEARDKHRAKVEQKDGFHEFVSTSNPRTNEEVELDENRMGPAALGFKVPKSAADPGEERELRKQEKSIKVNRGDKREPEFSQKQGELGVGSRGAYGVRVEGADFKTIFVSKIGKAIADPRKPIAKTLEDPFKKKLICNEEGVTESNADDERDGRHDAREPASTSKTKAPYKLEPAMISGRKFVQQGARAPHPDDVHDNDDARSNRNFRRQEMGEEAELTELSRDTLRSYKKKAAFDVASANATIGSFDKSESEKAKASAVRTKRNKGFQLADAKMRKEEVELDEISQKTATNVYANRANDEFEDDGFGEYSVKSSEPSGNYIKKKFGDDAMHHADKAADTKTFGRKDASGQRKTTGYEPLRSQPKPRIRKDGKINKSDTQGLKWEIKNRVKAGFHKKVGLPEETEVNESTQPYHAGYAAAKEGKSVKTNPHDLMTVNGMLWRQGHKDQKKDVKKGAPLGHAFSEETELTEGDLRLVSIYKNKAGESHTLWQTGQYEYHMTPSKQSTTGHFPKTKTWNKSLEDVHKELGENGFKIHHTP